MPVTLATQVGRPFDARTVEQDVRRLWGTGRFEDVRVTRDGREIVFEVVESHAPRLRAVRIEPPSHAVHVTARAGAPLTRERVQEIVRQAREQLRAQGYERARVDSSVLPAAVHEADLLLRLDPGRRMRIRGIEFAGDPVLPRRKIRRLLRTGSDWDAARVRTLYVERGYLDARIGVERNGERLQITVNAGRRYKAPGRGICSCLLAERREAWRQGVVDLSASVRIDRSGQVSTALERGRSYRVGRIEFTGHHHYSDSTLRRAFLLDEGRPFDDALLRASVARLNRAMLFEEIGEQDIAVRTDESAGVADIHIRLTERKRGAWRISGPVGPMSLAGPLEASISARLPRWSTYTVSIGLLAFGRPLLPLLSIASNRSLLPLATLRRPFLPGEGWRSGFAIAPQLGWRANVLSYAVAQAREHLLPALTSSAEPVLPVAIDRPAGAAVMMCEKQPRARLLRRAAAMAVEFTGALASL